MKKARCALLIAGTALTLAGCGGTGVKLPADTGPPVCNERDVEAMAHFLRVERNTITTSKSIGTNEMPQCTFVTRRSEHHRVLVDANVDDSSQPYQVLRRTIEEASQFFNVFRPSLAPSNVPGLGISASWFPDYHWLQATDGLHLITARVAWAGSTKKQKIALAQAMIRPSVFRAELQANAPERLPPRFRGTSRRRATGASGQRDLVSLGIGRPIA